MPRKIRNRADGRVHFSQLKMMAKTPAHYRAACERERDSTRPMRLGSLVHALILGDRKKGRPIIVYNGKDRRGNAWKDFVEKNAAKGELVTRGEYDAARPIADALVKEPQVLELLNEKALLEVPLQWEMGGVECATDGVDFIRPDLELVGELKVSHTSEPVAFMRHALKMWWHAQLSMLGDGAIAAGYPVKRRVIIAAELGEPHPVTVFNVAEDLALHGAKSVALWIEKLRRCEDADAWNAYAQSPVDFLLPEYLADEEDDDGDDGLVWPGQETGT